MVFIDFFNARAKVKFVLFKCCPSLQRPLKVSKYSGLHRPQKIMLVLAIVLVFFIRFGSKMGILFIGFGAGAGGGGEGGMRPPLFFHTVVGDPPSHTPPPRAQCALELASLALCPPHFQSCSKAYVVWHNQSGLHTYGIVPSIESMKSAWYVENAIFVKLFMVLTWLGSSPIDHMGSC